MELTVFKYITEVPAIIDAQFWAEFSIRCYNLGLTAMWFLLFWFIYDTFFTIFSKFYKRGHD